MTTDRRKIYGILAALVTLIAPWLIMHSDQHVETSQSLCPFKLLTGLPCPGCGITKSMIFIYRGELMKGLSYHIFGPLVILFSMAALIVLITEIITRREYFGKILFSRNIAYILGGVLASYHITRLIIFVSDNSVSDILRQSIWR